jgi:hypothetical protein
MSTRAQVLIKETGVYLYQHHDGYNLFDTVKKSLKRIEKAGRLNHPGYLTRMLFCDMIKVAEEQAGSLCGFNGSLGYGIDTERHGDIDYLITIQNGKATQEKI